MSRLISLSARGGIAFESILDQLKSCGSCPAYVARRAKQGDTSMGSSCPTAIGFALLDMQKEMLSEIDYIDCDDEDSYGDYYKYHKTSQEGLYEVKQEFVANPPTDITICPECGNDLARIGGCWQCVSCGYSKCD